ncbi:hypothetical protein JDV02_009373 [Purpureocillium takamizusanense]|uniref:Uncharacterized protein n=1 Tax=Purpureocillium takamizusanense TaxID=2060973 RepID=A0A9Q8QPT6_9HYPO|nr:uncharacterized protein JDV02_009373 [Purpureocillium takamizusanense]UNI23558.1 hypothetical protein JDV02_009373 [Purpureocillium takamizusanense]
MASQGESPARAYDPLYPQPIENIYLQRKLYAFRDAFEPTFARQTDTVKHQAAAALREIARQRDNVNPSSLSWYRGKKPVDAGTFLALGNWFGQRMVIDDRLDFHPSEELLQEIPLGPLVAHESYSKMKKRVQLQRQLGASTSSSHQLSKNDGASTSEHSDTRGSTSYQQNDRQQNVWQSSGSGELGGVSSNTVEPSAHREQQAPGKHDLMTDTSAHPPQKRHKSKDAAGDKQPPDGICGGMFDQSTGETRDITTLQCQLRMAKGTIAHLEKLQLDLEVRNLSVEQRAVAAEKSRDHLRRELAKLQTDLKAAQAERDFAKEPVTASRGPTLPEAASEVISENARQTPGAALPLDVVRQLLSDAFRAGLNERQNGK